MNISYLKRIYLDEINAMHQARFEKDESKEAIHRDNALEIMDKLALLPDDEEEEEG